MRFIHKLLNRLARRMVRNAPGSRFWKYNPITDTYSFLGFGAKGFLGREMQEAFPNGGWSWWRLLEIMNCRLSRKYEPKDWDTRLGR
ncbi:MAG: hypothetical protein Q8L53_16795 [Aestuariivirga sp.]|nr:hypothetical protein [Aestuariivirga sp.]